MTHLTETQRIEIFILIGCGDINVKVALFAASSISAGNLSSISASLTSFSLHSMFTNAIMWN
jgi:hypothetical protein